MSLRLPLVQERYNPNDQRDMYRILEQEDTRNQKKAEDILIKGADGGTDGRRLILVAPDGGKWKVLVDNSGNLSTVAV